MFCSVLTHGLNLVSGISKGAGKRRRSKLSSVPIQVVPTSLEIRRARRIASRTRSTVACAACKLNRTKCDQFRPCTRCKKIGKADLCVGIDQVSGMQQLELCWHVKLCLARMSVNKRCTNTRSNATRVQYSHNWCVDHEKA
jgi:hypothetical protein